MGLSAWLRPVNLVFENSPSEGIDSRNSPPPIATSSLHVIRSAVTLTQSVRRWDREFLPSRFPEIEMRRLLGMDRSNRVEQDVDTDPTPAGRGSALTRPSKSSRTH